MINTADPSQFCAIAAIRDEVQAARAAGALPPAAHRAAPGAAGPKAPASPRHLADSLSSAAAHSGIPHEVFTQAVESQLDLTGLLDAPPARQSLRALSRLLGIDAAGLASSSPPLFARLVDQLKGASLFNVTAPKDYSVAADGSVLVRQTSGGSSKSGAAPQPARIIIHTPITVVALRRLNGHSAVPRIPGRLVSASVTHSHSCSFHASAGGLVSHEQHSTSTSQQSFESGGFAATMRVSSHEEHHSQTSTAGSSASSILFTSHASTTHVERRPAHNHMSEISASSGAASGTTSSAMQLQTHRPPLQLLLSEPGLARKHSNGSVSVPRSLLTGFVGTPAQMTVPGGDDSWVRFDCCFPHGDDRDDDSADEDDEADDDGSDLMGDSGADEDAEMGDGASGGSGADEDHDGGFFFNAGLAKWQQARAAWLSPADLLTAAVRPQRGSPAATGSRRSSASAMLVDRDANGPGDGDDRGDGGASFSSGVDLDELYDLLASSEFTVPLVLPGRVRLGDMVATLAEIWEDASPGPGRGAGGGGSSSSDW